MWTERARALSESGCEMKPVLGLQRWMGLLECGGPSGIGTLELCEVDQCSNAGCAGFA